MSEPYNSIIIKVMRHEERSLFLNLRAVFALEDLYHTISRDHISVYFVNCIFLELGEHVDLTWLLKHSHCSELRKFILVTYLFE